MGNPPADFYEVLDIPKHASPQEIRAAYKALVKKWHPDKHPPSSKPEAEARFKSIIQAYEALHDQENRAMLGLCNGAAAAGGVQPPRESAPRSRGRDFFKGVHHFHPEGGGRPGSGFSSHTGPARRKPEAVERKLECTLEELCRGCRKEIKFTRDVVAKNGLIVKKEESQTIRVKPGWKKGTKITFEGMGDERPGCLPADVVFVIAEKEHPIFKRVGNDLVLKVEIPLVSALTGWTFSFRLLTGEKMTCSFQDEIIYPGFEKVIQGQGMPLPNKKEARGDLRIKFNIIFPTQLSSEQRSGITDILNDCT